MDSIKIQVYKLKSLFSSKIGIALLLITFLAGCIRFIAIDTLPVSLYWDEVSAGYNSYSILKTGKDEYGTRFPIVFRAFDDDKMPANIYLSTLPIAVFGLNEFSVRFTSALFGTASTLLLFLIVLKLWGRSKQLEKNKIGLLSALLLCLTPWHIIFSRTGFEANVAFGLTLLGTYLFLLGVSKPKYLFASVLIFIVDFYTYRSSVIIVPFLFLSLFVVYRKDLLKRVSKKVMGLLIMFFIISVSPLLIYWMQHGDVRSQQVSVFTKDNVSLTTSIRSQEQAGNTLVAKILYNRRVVYVQKTIQNYFSHFSPSYLFFLGDGNARHTVKSMGLLYPWQLPFILLGIFYFYKYQKKGFGFLLFWLMVSPIAASLSVPSPHALRSLHMVAPLTIFSAAGLYFFITTIAKSEKDKKYFSLAVILLLFISFILFAPRYIYHNSVTAASDWGDGYKQLYEEIKKQKNEYEKIIITGHYWQPYAYFLFFEKYDPLLYQTTGNQTGYHNYIFGGTSWDQRLKRQELNFVNLRKLSGTKSALVVLSPKEYSFQKKYIRKTKEIRDHAGKIVFIIGTLK